MLLTHLASADKIKEQLGRWITQDAVAEQVSERLNKLGISHDPSPIGIERRIDKSLEFSQLIHQINAHAVTAVASHITAANLNRPYFGRQAE